MDYDSIGAAGSFFGSAAIIVVDDRCCMVQLALRAAQFYMHESCGKCTPCRVGTRWLVQLLTKLEEGRGDSADLDLLDEVCDRMLGKSLCALGDFAVYPVSSYLRKYRSEFEAHVDGPRLPVRWRRARSRARSPRRSTRRLRTRTSSGERCMPELVYAHGGRRVGSGSRQHRPRRGSARRGSRDPRVLLRAQARGADRRLPHVPRRDRGDPQAPGGLHADGDGGDGRADLRRPPRRRRTARRRRSSSSSSTTRSTARSATRAASARSRT